MVKRPSEPRCARCNNEEDLRAHTDGQVYCADCWRGSDCTHGMLGLAREGLCLECLRRTHSIITFEGWRLADVVNYAISAFVDHGLKPDALRTWTYEEREILETIDGNAAWSAAIKETGPPGGWS